MNPSNKLTTEQFISKAKSIHGDKFDYSKTKYVNGETKVCIICPTHGESWILPKQHLIGFGCRRCGYENRKKSKCKPTEVFIESAKKVHGDFYDYSITIYRGQKKPITFICPKHGTITMNAGNHLHGHGCPKCGIEKRSNSLLSTTESFIERATKVHNGKYDYSKTVYQGISTKTCIICPKHGEFWQTPNNHLNGAECPKCGYLKTKSNVCGSGINDIDYYATSICYRKWKSILERTSPTYKNKAYDKVYICDEWRIFSNFKEWFDENYIEGGAIDKDLLSPPNNKIYSPRTCCFLPRIINNAIKKSPTNNQTGIRTTSNGRYRVILSANSKQSLVGYFNSLEEARLAYKLAKKQYIKELSEKYFREGKITERVYNALMKYEIVD